MRKKIKRKENKFDKLLEIPKEIATSTPRLIIRGFQELLVENYKGVLEYEENFIRIATYIGIVNINGINLKLNQMKDDTVFIYGQIESEKKKKDFDN